ncbi:cuticle protein 16.5-like [Pararge aegeria]|uniref:cuticle protein 16.5-like n=1 Tax=Pararge aegeria TaxID=116150 RepID=UPI0019D22366|nr:cuticle protein 16.5-like [Pararge aegeria]
MAWYWSAKSLGVTSPSELDESGNKPKLPMPPAIPPEKIPILLLPALPVLFALVACAAAGAVRPKRGVLSGLHSPGGLASSGYGYGGPALAPALSYSAPSISYSVAPSSLGLGAGSALGLGAGPAIGLATGPAIGLAAPAPAARIVTVNRLVNVNRVVSVPQVVHVQKVVSVPQVISVNKLVAAPALSAPGYGGCAAGRCGAALGAGW